MCHLSIAIQKTFVGTGLRLDNHPLNRNHFWRKSIYFQDFRNINLSEKKARFLLVFVQCRYFILNFFIFYSFFSHFLINLLYCKYVMLPCDAFSNCYINISRKELDFMAYQWHLQCLSRVANESCCNNLVENGVLCNPVNERSY